MNAIAYFGETSPFSGSPFPERTLLHWGQLVERERQDNDMPGVQPVAFQDENSELLDRVRPDVISFAAGLDQIPQTIDKSVADLVVQGWSAVLSGYPLCKLLRLTVSAESWRRFLLNKYPFAYGE